MVLDVVIHHRDIASEAPDQTDCQDDDEPNNAADAAFFVGVVWGYCFAVARGTEVKSLQRFQQAAGVMTLLWSSVMVVQLVSLS
jgi:hypothetical protein